MFKRVLSIAITAAMMLSILTACGSGSSGNQSAQASQAPAGSAVKDVPAGVATPKKVAVIRGSAADDNSQQFFAGVKDTLGPYGWTIDTFLANGDNEQFRSLVEQAIAKNYDGIIISSAQESYAYNMIKPAADKGIKVIAFDSPLKGPNGETSIPGVTVVAQNDKKLAELSLNEALKYAKGGNPLRLIGTFFGPGFAPFDNRDSVLKQFINEGKIKKLETIAPSSPVNAQADVANKVGAVLPKYKTGDLDVIWGMWDEMAKGAVTALKEAGRTDVKVFSIDISNQDINMMRENKDIWPATAAVDTHLIGQQLARLVALKFAGEPTPATYSLEPVIVKSADLKKDTTVSNLKDVVPGWGVSKDFYEPWMDKLVKK